MTSIIKVDQIQTAAGGVPTASDLGLNVSGGVNRVLTKQTAGEVSTSSQTAVNVLSKDVAMDTDLYDYLITFHTPVKKGSSAGNDGVNLYIKVNNVTKGTVYHRLFDASTNTYANQSLHTYITSGFSGGASVPIAGAVSSYNGDSISTHDNSPDATSTGSRLIILEIHK